MDITTKFEKNRLALLRMVSYWLALAFVVRLARQALPSRIARFVSGLLFKVEAATGYLIIIANHGVQGVCTDDSRFLNAAKRHSLGLGTCEAELSSRLDDIIIRLRTLRATLRALRNCAMTAGKPVILQWSVFSYFETISRSVRRSLFGYVREQNIVPP